jgi:hypothetical protein
MIFKTLLERGIPYSVCVSQTSMKLSNSPEYSNDYFIIIAHCDIKLARDLQFHSSSNKFLAERDLTAYEIREFKRMDFKKILHTKNGRVFENEPPFREYYLKMKPMMIKYFEQQKNDLPDKELMKENLPDEEFTDEALDDQAWDERMDDRRMREHS